MSELEDLFHAIVFLFLLVGVTALAVYGIWLIPLGQTLKWIFSVLVFAVVFAILLVGFEKVDWDWWKSF